MLLLLLLLLPLAFGLNPVQSKVEKELKEEEIKIEYQLET